MKTRLFALLTGFALVAGVASAQTTGEIYGKVTDKSGAVVPGATVTLSGPSLLRPQTAVTSGTGVYRFPSIPIGTYTVKFELAGFSTVVREGVVIEIGLNAQINATMQVSQMQEVVTVQGESPLVDLKDNTRATHFNQEALEKIPSARDPWVIMQQSAGIVMDRENIGGNMSGQQSNFIARGAATTQQKWNLDGVDITDMSATGASPVYYDFDAFGEMQMTTGGADVTMMSPGVGVNLLTKSGSDKFKGSARYFVTDQKFQSTNVTDALRQQGATSGNPIQNIKDYGAELGGPIVKGKLWAWGSYGKQDIKVGVNNFFLKTAECAGVTPSTAAATSFDLVKSCLNTDLTTLDTYNAKLNYQPSAGTQFSLFFNRAGKIRNARGADDLHPIESTNRQAGVTDPSLGSSFWKTGIPKTYKLSARHTFSDRFMMEFQFAHVGNNFVLDFHDDSLASVQPSFEITTSLWGRSFNASQFVRPTNSFDLTGTRTSSGFLGGDHAIRFGLRHRQDRALSTNHRGGNVEARFRNGVPAEANMYRDSFTDYNVFSNSAYFQDVYTRGRLTVSVGARFDQQWDRTNPSAVPAHPFFGQATITGAIFNHLPALNFAGYDPKIKFNDLSPRIGINWDLNHDGRSVLRLNYARYAGQLGNGDLASTYNPVQASFIRFPWTDLNGDKFVQANEINITGTPLSFGGNYNPNNPSALSSPGTVDPNLRNEHTDEYIVGFDKQIGSSFAVGIAGIYRKYKDFRWNDRVNFSDANYVARSFTPAASACPASQGAQCPTFTYFEPTIPIPAAYVYANSTYGKEYKGVELTMRKRMAKRFMMNGSFTYSSTPQFYPAGSFEDPTNISNLDGSEYSPVTSGSGIDNVYINAKWLARVTASYTLPWQDIGLAAFWNGRSGYPQPLNEQTPSRANSAGTANVYLQPLGDFRLPNFQNLDARIEKPIKLGRGARLTVSMDVFNVFNDSTVLSQRGVQNASNANLISSLVAPRVIRFGAHMSW